VKTRRRMLVMVRHRREAKNEKEYIDIHRDLGFTNNGRCSFLLKQPTKIFAVRTTHELLKLHKLREYLSRAFFFLK